jgi:hypothetical protein
MWYRQIRNKIWRMCFARRITIPRIETRTPNVEELSIFFPRQKWLRERSWMLRHTYCTVPVKPGGTQSKHWDFKGLNQWIQLMNLRCAARCQNFCVALASDRLLLSPCKLHCTAIHYIPVVIYFHHFKNNPIRTSAYVFREMTFFLL